MGTRHKATKERRARVLILATGLGGGKGITEESIAADLEICVETLQKHYSSELSKGRTDLYARAVVAAQELIGECDPQIVKLVLSGIGGIGASQTIEHTGKDGAEIIPIINISGK